MLVAMTTTPRTTTTKWIIDPDATTFIGPLNHGEEADALQYIRLLTSANGTPVDTIAEIDVDPCSLDMLSTIMSCDDTIHKSQGGTPGKIWDLLARSVRGDTCHAYADGVWATR